jgi:3-methyl-2-oxobutanoate hydroxymethyltransferase
MNKKIRKILNQKNKSTIVCLTAYSKNTAKILDKYCDIVLVGDSMANVLYGLDSTNQISLDNIIQHTISVKKGINKSLLISDMPKNSYKNKKLAEKNAKLIIKKTGCDGVKIESNGKNHSIISMLVKKNIPVMGHIGYTPQFKKKFKVEGDTITKAKKLLNEAKQIQNAGAFSIVLECIYPNTSKLITSKLKIPTIGIGSSLHCDGQILVTDDMLGVSGFYPKFVKKYANLNRLIEIAVKKYSRDVILKKFPTKNNYLNGSKNRK